MSGRGKGRKVLCTSGAKRRRNVLRENIENTTRQPSSVAPGRAQVAQQSTIITGHEGKSIQFSPLLFA
jgi:hypothetical protein